MLKYWIFGSELIAVALWLAFGPHHILAALLGVVIIIAISQILHIWLNAR